MAIEKLRPAFTFTEDRLAELRAVLPEVFADGNINWETLREALGDYLADEGAAAEHFGLFWPGKREARRLAAISSKGSLRPALGEGVAEDNTRNLFIEGDNLEVLKLLQKSYARRVKMIYIDPPYNTGNDFVYQDDFAEALSAYLKLTKQADEGGKILTTNANTAGRFHSNWLNMMYPRLSLARLLLRDDGIIFISIDETELANLILMMNELFGEENQEAVIAWRRRHNQPNDKTKMISTTAEFIVAYARNSEVLKRSAAFYGIPLSETRQNAYGNPDNDPNGPWDSKPWKAASGQSGSRYTILTPTGKVLDEEWLGSPETFNDLLSQGRIYFPKDGEGWPRKKFYLSERMSEGQCAHNFWDHERFGSNQEASTELASLLGEKGIFTNPKPSRLVRMMATLSTGPNDLILDFFAGSCTTAHAVYDLNREDGGKRRYICVQLPEPTPVASQARKAGYNSISEVGKERIRQVLKRMPQPMDAGNPGEEADTSEDLGFKVYKLHRSNFKVWQDYNGDDLQALQTSFDEMVTPLVDGWKRDDLLAEVQLIEGFPLDSRVEPAAAFTANTVQHITFDALGHHLYVCLDEKIDGATVEQLGRLRPEDIFVCLDSALTNEAKQRLMDVCTLRVI